MSSEMPMRVYLLREPEVCDLDLALVEEDIRRLEVVMDNGGLLLVEVAQAAEHLNRENKQTMHDLDSSYVFDARFSWPR